MVLDTSNTEQLLNFVGKADTNSLSSNKSISVGDNHIYIANTSDYIPSFQKHVSEFMLTKTDLNGVPLWTKYYGNDSKLELQKVIATSDGGAIMVGSSYDTLNFSSSIRDIHIVKVDSNGLQTTTSLNENVVETKTLVYPNPTSSTIHFSFSVGSFHEEMELEMYNSNGQLMQQESMQTTDAFDVSSYESGLYFYIIGIDDKTFKGKFIVGTD